MLTHRQWQDFSESINATNFFHYDGNKLVGIVSQVEKKSLLYWKNALLHIFGLIDAEIVKAVSSHLFHAEGFQFCQILIPDHHGMAASILEEAGAIEVEQEILLRADGVALKERLRSYEPRMQAAFFRKCVPEDGPIIHQIFKNAFFADISFEIKSVNVILSEAEKIYVAEIDDKIVGSCMADFERNSVWIDEICVAARFRRQGIAHGLMKIALESCPACDFAKLNVSSKNTEAISLYDRLGFQECGRLRRYVISKDEVNA